MSEPYAPKLRRPATLDHLKKKEPLERTVSVILSDAPIQELEQAREALGNASTDEERQRARDAIAAARTAVEEVTVEIKFRSIGRKAYDALVDMYPPTDKQIADLKAEGIDGRPAYNVDTFPPALVAASALEPQMSAEDAQEIWDTWNTNELTDLFMAAMNVNTGRRVADLGKGFGEMSD